MNTSKSQVNSQYGLLIRSNETLKVGENMIIQGEYRVPYPDFGIPKDAVQIPKHIALVVTRSANYAALKPLYDKIVFEDDIKADGKVCAGYFNFNVFDYIEFKFEGDYFILCSLGTYISNIIKVSMRNPE